MLLAYAKIDLYGALLDSDVPEDPYLSAELQDYFPAPLPERFGERMDEHRLRREIVATQVVNNLLHGGGTTFAFRMHEESGAPASDIARAYTVAREVFGMRPQWAEIEALDNSRRRRAAGGDAARGPQAGGARVALAAAQPPVPDEHRGDGRRTSRPARRCSTTSVARLLGADGGPVTQRAAELEAAGVPAALAARVAGLGWMVAALDIVDVAGEAGLDVEVVAAVHFRLGSVLELHWLRDRILDLPRADRWSALARAALRDDLFALHRALTAEVLRDSPPGADVDDARDRLGGREPGRRALPADPGRHPGRPRVRPDDAARRRARGAQPDPGEPLGGQTP